MHSNPQIWTLLGIFYGFIVIAIGVVAFLLPRKVASAKIRESLWLLGTFGLLHGLRSWMVVAEMLAPNTVPDRSLVLLTLVGHGMNAMALLCLGQFTTEILAIVRSSLAWLRWVPLSCFTTWVAALVGGPALGLRLTDAALAAPVTALRLLLSL